MDTYELINNRVKALRLCDGQDEKEVDHLYTWMEEQGSVDWEGDESGITIHTNENNVFVRPGDWIVKIGYVFVCLTNDEFSQMFKVASP